MSSKQPGIYASLIHGGFPDEPSLFEELGIHNADVKNNVLTILLPNKAQKTIESNILINIFFYAAYATLLFLLKKPRFGMVYMITLFGVGVLYFVFSSMYKAYSDKNDFTVSTLFTPLSYCLPPLFPIALISRLFSMKVATTMIIGIPFYGWSSYCAARYLSPIMSQCSIELLIFPIAVFYAYMLLLPLI